MTLTQSPNVAARRTAGWGGRCLQRPGGAEDDEFDDGVIDAAYTVVTPSGTDPGSFIERYGSMYFKMTAQPTSSRFKALLKAHTFSVGDFIESRVYPGSWTNYMCYGIMISDGTTFGAGNQVSVLHYGMSDIVRYELNSNFGGSVTEGSAVTPRLYHDPVYFRLKYEAANTFGAFMSTNGVTWYTLGTGISKTMTPSQIGLCVYFHTPPSSNFPSGSWDYLRVNPADE